MAAPSSQLAQWPVQIKLAPVNAPWFHGAHLLVAADCTAYALSLIHICESYLLFAAAAQPCNGGTCTACCAYGAAESREPAYFMLDMNGRQIADNQCAQKLFMGRPQCGGILCHGHADSEALVSTAGIDDNG